MLDDFRRGTTLSGMKFLFARCGINRAFPAIFGSFTVWCALFALWLGASLQAQTSLQISTLRLRFTVAQRTAQMDDATKAEVRKLETAIRRESLAGQTGLVFRDMNKGIALMQHKPWTAAEEFATSLYLATDTAVCDPAQPLSVKLTQYYPAKLDGASQLSGEVSLGIGGGLLGKRARPGKPAGKFQGDASDLLGKALAFTVNLGDAKDGGYALQVTLRNGDKVAHKLALPIFLVRGMEAKQAAMEKRLKAVNGFEPAKASVRYPFDFARTVNLGRLPAADYDFAAGIAKSEAILTALEAGKDPFANVLGVQQRHYFFAEADEIMPYHLFVPKGYDGTKPFPLIVALHGLGGSDSSMMEGYGKILPKLAEEHGYMVAAPMGYRRNGGYGRVNTNLTVDATMARTTQLSELDVMNVLKLVREQFKIDANRTYLMGHSMGGYGTYMLGNKHNEIWAALAPIAGGNPPGLDLNRLKGIPLMIVHGDNDNTVPVSLSRTAVAGLKKLGLEHEYIEVPGGGHSDVVAPNLPKIVDFFDKHARQTK